MGDTRRVGYGFNRSPGDFLRASVDDLWLDTEKTDRTERTHLIRLGLRRGDTLVVIKISDLGAGKGLRNLRAALEERGVTIEVFEPEPEERRAPGRPPASDLTDEEWDRFEVMWRDEATDGAYLLKKACAAMGKDYADKKAREQVRQRLYRRFKVKRSEGEPS